MFLKWGGIPSVSVFRHNDQILPNPAKIKYHEKLALITGIQAPSAFEESEDSDNADEVYRSWSDHLRAQSRDAKKFPLLFIENINYGFRRNLLGIKSQCLLSSLVGAALIVIPKRETYDFSQTEIATLGIISLYALTLLFAVNANWVHTTATEYAKRLVETIS